MKRAVTIGLAAAAIAVALSPLAASGTERDQIEVANYQRGARIIRVPQPGDRDEDSDSFDRRDRPALSHDDDDVELPPPAPRRRVTPVKPHARPEPRATVKESTKESAKELSKEEIKPPAQTSAARNAPRWKPRSEASPSPPPPPSRPRRAVLSAPPPLAEGPTPLRPTPDFESRVGVAEKFLGPPPSEVSEVAPPRGYKPPALPALPEAGEDTTEK